MYVQILFLNDRVVDWSSTFIQSFLNEMKAEIITIGDEILIGQIVDTNSAWMANLLYNHGIEVAQITSITDEKNHIVNALDDVQTRADLILITGGLGPTKDDITKDTLCAYFNDHLEFRQDVFNQVKSLFDSYGVKMPAINRHQAEVPSTCITLMNKKGTAPGMWFRRNNKVIVSMPGVPYEMKYLMEQEVLPRVKTEFETPELVYKTILTQGIGESSLMEILGGWENTVLNDDLRLAWLPAAGKVRLRVSGKGSSRIALEAKIATYVKQLPALIPDHYVGHETDALEVEVGNLLKKKGWTVSTAESCTGGNIAHMLTAIAGSSAYFEGSIVSYSNKVKETVLGVSWESIKKHGAVSKQVVEEMVSGVRQKLGTDCAIATSGIAGPDGGSANKPVGTIWIAVATPAGVLSERFQFGNDREKNILRASQTALHLLQKELLK